MDKLKAANLYRSELIPISGKLVERYNLCLEKLGFKRTKLKSFSIDGLGWSPEIAEEKKDMHYLNHGDANQHAIIVSPQQKGKPVYVPTHSFDRDIMKLVFKEYGTQIKDITRDCALCLNFDQKIDALYEPLDVLKYNSLSIGFSLINNLDKLQIEQQELIELFKRDNNFVDEDIHERLLESAKIHGDLRNRELSLKPLTFESSSFYTKAYGGMYVLRDFISPIVVFEDEEAHKKAIKDTIHEVLIYHIDEPQLMNKLRDHLIIECELEKVVKTERYERIRKVMFHEVLEKAEHSIDSILNDKVLFKSYLNRIDVKALKKVNGVEIYLERLERSNAFKINDLVDLEMYNALHSPHSSLEAMQQDLIWKLLVNVSKLDLLFLYWYDKEEFYVKYQAWDESFQNWVINMIRNKI